MQVYRHHISWFVTMHMQPSRPLLHLHDAFHLLINMYPSRSYVLIHIAFVSITGEGRTSNTKEPVLPARTMGTASTRCRRSAQTNLLPCSCSAHPLLRIIPQCTLGFMRLCAPLLYQELPLLRTLKSSFVDKQTETRLLCKYRTRCDSQKLPRRWWSGSLGKADCGITLR